MSFSPDRQVARVASYEPMRTERRSAPLAPSTSSGKGAHPAPRLRRRQEGPSTTKLPRWPFCAGGTSGAAENGWSRTVAVWDAVRAMGLERFENLSYPRGLKRLLEVPA